MINAADQKSPLLEPVSATNKRPTRNTKTAVLKEITSPVQMRNLKHINSLEENVAVRFNEQFSKFHPNRRMGQLSCLKRMRNL